MFDKQNENDSKKPHRDIGNRLLAKRKELGHTQEQMAEYLDINVDLYEMIERGEKTPGLEKLITIYEKLGMNAKDLHTDDGKEASVASIIEQSPKEKGNDSKRLIKYAQNFIRTIPSK